MPVVSHGGSDHDEHCAQCRRRLALFAVRSAVGHHSPGRCRGLCGVAIRAYGTRPTITRSEAANAERWRQWQLGYEASTRTAVRRARMVITLILRPVLGA